MIRRLLTTLALCGVLTSTASVFGVPPSSAEPTPQPRPDVAPTLLPTQAGTEGDPLIRARRALAGTPGPHGPHGGRVDATMALRDLFLARPTMDAERAATAGQILARPTDGAADPYAAGYTTRSKRLCGERVCVHWVPNGRDAPPDRAWVDTTLQVMERVWTAEVDDMGYRAPATDGRRGGDARFDVYLKELGSQGLYGYCAPEAKVAGRQRQAFGFCVLDNNFATMQYGGKPKATLKVTAAHEFFHAIQFAYDFREDPWLLESTATWMEDQVADGVNDNRTYLPYGQLRHPKKPLDTFSATGYNQYGNWLFWEFLSQRYTPTIVRRVIARAGTGEGRPNDYSAEALRNVLAKHGGLSKAYAAFAVANLRAAARYDEGRAYRATRPRSINRIGAGLFEFTTKLNHLSSTAVRLIPAPQLQGPRWKIAVSVDAPGAVTSPTVVALIEDDEGRMRRTRVHLDRHGDGRLVLPFSVRTTRTVTLVLVNASTRYRCGQDTTFSCHGVPRDNKRAFTLRATVRR